MKAIENTLIALLAMAGFLLFFANCDNTLVWFILKVVSFVSFWGSIKLIDLWAPIKKD